MRIAVCHNLPSGGARRAVWELLRHLKTSEHGDHLHLDEFYLEGADDAFLSFAPWVGRQHVFPFAPLGRLRRPLSPLNGLLRLAETRRLREAYRHMAGAVNRGGYDLVWAHNCRFGGPPAVMCFADIPSLYYSHSAHFPDYVYVQAGGARGASKAAPRARASRPPNPLSRLADERERAFRRGNYHAARRVLTNSAFMCEYLAVTEGVGATFSPLGVDTGAFHPGEIGAAGEGYVLSVAALAPHKGHDFVLRSLGRLPAALRPPVVIVANLEEGSERERLTRLAQEQGVDLSLVVGVHDQARLRRYYQECALLAAGAYLEPFGLNVLEAMACARPVVAVAEGGFRETVRDGETGILTPRDEDAFGQAVAALWQSSPAQRQTLGARGRVVARERWSWPAASRQMLTHLEQTAAAPRAPSK